jgi:hypothetical protein
MRKLIEIKVGDEFIVCDNTKCDYTMPENSEHEELHKYINKPCPMCGENLLTTTDYKQYMNVLKYIAWLNKWFSWLTVFGGKRKGMGVHVHEGINITDTDGKDNK